jgi:DNA-binding transcriptional MerR regulator
MNPDDAWRIDELAQKAGLTVDTIRYYAREGLLRPPVKKGRNRYYGADHLERLERICELRSRRFSLAAIKAIVDVDRPGLEGLFTTTGREYSLGELTERAELDPDLVEQLRSIGLLPDPADFGGDAYDETDVAVLRAVGELRAIGMTDEVVIALGRVYVEHLVALQHDVLDMLSGNANPGWDPEELVTIQQNLTANAPRLMPAIDQLLSYIHQRTLQRLTLEAARDSTVDE